MPLPKTATAFTRRLLSMEDWDALQAASPTPLHQERQVTSLSEGQAISPLAQQALLTLASPSPKRLMALRAALKKVPSPDLQVHTGPYGELGLLMLVTDVSLWDRDLDHLVSYRRALEQAVERQGLNLTQAWEAAWVSLDGLKEAKLGERGAYHKGIKLTFKETWSRWFSDLNSPSPSRSLFAPPPLPAMVAQVDRHVRAGEGGPWLTEGGWRLMWLVDHHDPAWVAQHLDTQVRLALDGLAEEQRFQTGRGSWVHPSYHPDDAVLAESLDQLTRRLDRTLDLDWSAPDLAAHLPQCHARHRALALQQRPVSPRPTRSQRYRI